MLTAKGVQTVDRRTKGGSLWAIGGEELTDLMDEFADHGATFTYKANGGRATNFKAAWWLAGYPAKSAPAKKEPETSAVTETQVNQVEEGTQVFHKSFGYGEVVSIDGNFVSVRFDNDRKKKARMFMYPAAFYQGMLQL